MKPRWFVILPRQALEVKKAIFESGGIYQDYRKTICSIWNSAASKSKNKRKGFISFYQEM